jgi:hypothetical protein
MLGHLASAQMNKGRASGPAEAVEFFGGKL